MSLPGKSVRWRVVVTGGAGFVGSTLVKRIEREWENAEVTVIDDFRSGHFKNLEGFRGEVIAQNLTKIKLKEFFEPKTVDAIFHLASITDTREQDQRKMTWDNVESFRRLLEFAREKEIPITYASSAATYGIDARINNETDERKPANVYGFSKVQLENLAAKYLAEPELQGWKISGVRYFNVFGPGEAHKGVMASMIYQLYLQMKAGKRPRVFRSGEHKRDFVHVDDVVNCTLLGHERRQERRVQRGQRRSSQFQRRDQRAQPRNGNEPEAGVHREPVCVLSAVYAGRSSAQLWGTGLHAEI